MNPRGLGRDVISDDALLARLAEQLGRSRRVEAELVAVIAEVDARRLYLREACRSMHVYVTERLHLSDAEAYLRITVARLSRRFPMILSMLADGRLHLSAIAKLGPHLRAENGDAVLARAARLSKREIEVLVAELSPRPDAPALIRRLPDRQGPSAGSNDGSLRPDGVVSSGATGESAVPGRRAFDERAVGSAEHATSGPGSSLSIASASASASGTTCSTDTPFASSSSAASRAGLPPRLPGSIAPTSPGRYKVQFTAGDELRGKIARVQALLRHQVPDGDLAVIMDRAMTLLLDELERARFAATSSPRKSAGEVDPTPSSRSIPASIRRAVWRRDGGQCTFRSPRGERCSATERLEFHHVIPFAQGGDHSESNVRLLCRGHNVYQAEIDFGAACIAAHRRRVASDDVSVAAGCRVGRDPPEAVTAGLSV